MAYQWIILAHVASAFLFFTAHGIPMGVAFRLLRERRPERLSMLLDLSQASRVLANAGLLALLATGIVAGFMTGTWRSGWIWVSLGLILLISVGMSAGMGPYFNQLRKAAGSSYREAGKLPVVLGLMILRPF